MSVTIYTSSLHAPFMHLKKVCLWIPIILPEFETRELVNNFRNLTISNEKTDTPKIRSSLQSQSCS